MAQDYHCKALWLDMKWRREKKKKKKKTGRTKANKYGRKPWPSYPETGRFPEETWRLRRKLVPESVVGRRVLQ